MPNRLHQLDAIRGLAALSVVLHHCLRIPSGLDGTLVSGLLHHTPLAVLVAGPEAVLLFFVLSGFVLSLPFFRGPVSYPQFIIKRICRIYLPYYAAVALAVVGALLTWRGGIPALGAWFNLTWTTPITPSILAQHALLVGSFPTATLNTAIWSLVHEMRISLIFPPIALLVVRGNWKVTLGIAASLMVVSAVVMRALPMYTGWLLSVSYTSFFIVGCLLAKHRATLAEAIAHISVRMRLGLLFSAVMLYTFKHWAPIPNSLPGDSVLSDWAILTGASIFVILALGSRSLSEFLKWRPIHLLGQISYSVYLLHGTLLFALVNLFYGKIPMWSIWLLTVVGTLLLSSLMYYAVEIPSINAGRYLAGRLFPSPRGRGEEAPAHPPAQPSV